MSQSIEIAELTIDETLHVRGGVDSDYADNLASILRTGGKLDPVSVVKVRGRGSYLVDGFDTIEAHRIADRTHALANVRSGTWEDVVIGVLRSNRQHRGRPLLESHKRNKVLLAIYHLPTRSSRWIATEAGVSLDLVNRLRIEQEAAATQARSGDSQLYDHTVDGQTNDKREGADGRMRGPRHQAPQAAPLAFTPGAATHYVPPQAPHRPRLAVVEVAGLPDVAGLLGALETAIHETASVLRAVETADHERALRLVADLRTHWEGWTRRKAM